MNVVFFNMGPDTAGTAIGLKQAFDRHAPEWSARAICREIVYLDYPPDIHWPRKSPPRLNHEVTNLVRRADVLHVLDREQGLATFAPWLRRQTLVMHHLGSRFRRDPVEVSAYCQTFGATEVTDSIDLVFPDVAYLPVPADLDALAELRRATYRRSKRIRIAHAPTNRELKSTEIIIAAVEALAKRYPIDFDLIERVPHRECLERKAQADIFVDQLLLGFGLNNIECWAMGIPVVSGLVDAEARLRGLEMWGGQFPWADASAATLEAVIEHLIVDRAWRKELVERGRRRAWRWHSQESVVRQTLAVYEQAGMRVAA